MINRALILTMLAAMLLFSSFFNLSDQMADGEISFFSTADQIAWEDPLANESYDMLIICPDEFRSIVDDHARYRNETGIDTIPVNLEDIWSGLYWERRGSDPQEQMKYFIYNATLNWDIEHVLLAGDVDMVPARYVLVLDGNDDSGSSSSDGAFVPSDLYFSDIYKDGTTVFSSWNEYTTGDHASLWGEFDGSALDLPDLIPDLNIGRLPASTEFEMDLMFAKVRAYELSAKGSSWISNTTLSGTDVETGDGFLEGEVLCDHVVSSYLDDQNISRYYESLGNLGNITEGISNNTGFALLSGTGDYNEWGFTSNISGALGLLDAWSMDNGAELPIVIMDSGYSHGFDNENASDDSAGKDPVYNQWYYPPGFNQRGRDSLAEFLHLARIGGAVATFGSTRDSFSRQGNAYMDSLSGYMADHLARSMFNGTVHAGTMLRNAVTDYVNEIGSSSVEDYKTVVQYIMLGDPALNIGGIDTPSINITSEEEVVDVAPGTTTNVTISIENIGTVNASLEIQAEVMDAGASGWSADIRINQTSIQAGAEFDDVLSISAPDIVTAGNSKTVKVTVDSLLFLEPYEFYLEAVADSIWGVSLNMTQTYFYAEQGSDVSGILDVINTGNDNEEFILGISGLPVGWTWFLENSSITADPYEAREIPFMISIPDPEVSREIDLTIKVLSNITDANDTLDFSVMIEVESGLYLNIAKKDLHLDDRGRANTTISIKNNGNSEVNVEMEFVIPINGGWNISFSEYDLDIAPFETRNIQLDVEGPARVDPEEYSIFVYAKSSASEVVDEIKVIVPEVYGFQAVMEIPLVEMDRGTESEIAVNTSNLGNIFDRYSMDVSPMETERINVTPELDEFSVSSGSYRVVWLDIEAGNAVNGTYEIGITISSTNSNLTIDLRAYVIVRASYGFSVNEVSSPWEALPGYEMMIELDLVNNGNTNDTFDIEISPPEGWSAHVPSRHLDFGPGLNGTLAITASVPDAELAGIHEMSLEISSRGLNSTRILTLDLRVLDVFGLSTSIAEDERSLLIKAGRSITITLTVENTGNTLDQVDIGISGEVLPWIDISSSELTNLRAGERREVTITIAVPRNTSSGSHTFSIFISSSGDIESIREEVTIEVEERGQSGILSSFNIIPVSVTLIIGLILIIVVIYVVLRVHKKTSGMDIEEAGMEWEEDEDLWDDDDES